ncbi:MAG: TlyA family rRNA (cytidine-2'-O)-methyltransferase [Phycisphaerae bacterium]|nr:TlyA family rRNA (cytidine-2'-O)-methyltransferase [Phycisphaerae bacterium]
MHAASAQYVSRAGDKLHAALEAFGVDVRGAVCADFGCNIGGFTDCLLRHGARRVYAVDTGYGALAWTLRRDPRVAVLERTNALHAEPPEPADVVTIDVGWTVQQRIIPAAFRWLKRDAAGRAAGEIISLLKPHYELAKLRGHRPPETLSHDEARRVCLEVCRRLAQDGYAPTAVMQSVLLGKGGNVEFLLLLDCARTGLPTL